MTNPYRTQRERTAYELGVADGRAERPPAENGEMLKLLTRQQVLAMSTEEINRNWLAVQAAMAAGLPSGDDDE